MKAIDIALKDLLRSFRSLFAVGMMVVAPLLLTGLIYLAFGGVIGSQGEISLPALRVGVVNQDVPPAGQPALGALLIEMFSDPSVSSWLQVTTMEDEASARAAVDRQEIGVAVIVPAGFTEGVLAGRGDATLALIQDPTLSVGPAVVKNMADSFLDGIGGARIAVEVAAARASAQGLPLDATGQQALAGQFQAWFTDFQRTLYHSPDAALVMRPAPAAGQETESQKSMGERIMGLIMAGQMVFFGFYTGAYAMTSILREQEEGTLARLFTTPTARTLILTGKMLAVIWTVIVQALVLLAVGRLAFGLRWGNPFGVALVVVGQVAAASGLGVLLISVLKDTRQTGPVLGGGLSALGMLGGLFTVGVPNMPPLFDVMSLFTPHGWVIRGWKLVMAGGTPADVLLPALVSLAMGAAMFAAGAFLFRRRFA